MTRNDGRPLIALVSAVSAAIPPAEAAFAEVFPEAVVWNILDDRLLLEIDERGSLTPELAERMTRLIRHAAAEGADGILLTCSIYGTVAHAVAGEIDVPLYGADDAGFDAVVHSGLHSILLVSPAPGPLADSARRLAIAAENAGVDLSITPVVAEDAAALARSGDIESLARLLHGTVLAVDTPADAVLLGQFSISPAAARLAELTGLPVFATPQSAARALRSSLAITGDSQ